MKSRVRPAIKSDCNDIHDMVKQLALFEKEPDAVKLHPRDYEILGFESNPPLFYAAIAEVEENDLITNDGEGKWKPVGFAIYFYTFSTWEGVTLYLEDLFVKDEVRGMGVGSCKYQSRRT